jgi:mono/diheme cytochrome c family protein
MLKPASFMLLSIILAAPACAQQDQPSPPARLAQQGQPGTPAAPAPAGRLTGDAGRGAAMARRWCRSCHVVDGAQSAADTAPTFRSIARDPHKSPDYLRAFLARPHPPMPPLQFSRGEIEDFVAYFAELAKR